MPQPTQSDVHIDAVLTNISVAYIQSQERFVANQVFPTVPVQKQSDKYFVYTKNDWFRDEARVRPDGTESVGSGYGLSTATYSADVYAFHKDVGAQMRANYDNPLDPDRDATQFVTQRMLLRQEVQWAADYFTTNVWATDRVPTTLWSAANSVPIADIETSKETILSNTGFMPNTLVLGYQVFRQLKHHPEFVDRIKYTTASNVTTDILARFLDVERVIVCSAIKATNSEGDATSAYSFTHGKNALMCYVNPVPSVLAPSAGYQFSWQGVSDGMGANVGVSRFNMPELRADRIEAQMAWDNKVVAADLGYFFNGAVA